MSVHLTNEDLREFQRLCQEHLGLRLSTDRAFEHAYRLIAFIDTARTADPRTADDQSKTEARRQRGRKRGKVEAID